MPTAIWVAFISFFCILAFYMSLNSKKEFLQSNLKNSLHYFPQRDAAPIYCVIEWNYASDICIGKIVGFPHIKFSGDTVADVMAKAQEHTFELVFSNSLILESEFVGVFRL